MLAACLRLTTSSFAADAERSARWIKVNPASPAAPETNVTRLDLAQRAAR
jgi:hypothetical protein